MRSVNVWPHIVELRDTNIEVERFVRSVNLWPHIVEGHVTTNSIHQMKETNETKLCHLAHFVIYTDLLICCNLAMACMMQYNHQSVRTEEGGEGVNAYY